jgi:tyrosyl-tRNA synthetase
MFGKLVRISDELIPEYRLLTLDFFRDPAETDRVREGLADGTLDPWEEKRRMAREVVDLYHGPGAGEAAQTRFDRVHHDRELPEAVEEHPIPAEALRDGSVYLPKLMAVLGLARSNSQARGLIRQSGVRLDGAVVTQEELPESEVRGRVLQVGRREFVRLR